MAARRLAGVFVAVALVGMLGLTGCNQDNTPKEYGTLTQQNFLELCTNRYYDNTDDTLAQTDRTIAADVTTPTNDQCQCQYDVFSSQMPIADFTTLNGELKSNPEEAWATVPESITTALTGCMSATSAPNDPAPTDAATTTTAAIAEPATTVAP
jgi:hypothetical protein